MTTFKTVVRRKRADGFYPVYIRVVHRTKMGYISTGKIVTDKQLLKSGDIKDPVVNEYCSRQILRFSEIMNKKDFTKLLCFRFDRLFTSFRRGRLFQRVCFSIHSPNGKRRT